MGGGGRERDTTIIVIVVIVIIERDTLMHGTQNAGGSPDVKITIDSP